MAKTQHKPKPLHRAGWQAYGVTLVPRCRKAFPSLTISNGVQRGTQTLMGCPHFKAVPTASPQTRRAPVPHRVGFPEAHMCTPCDGAWGTSHVPKGAEAQEEHHPPPGRVTSCPTPHWLCGLRVSAVLPTALAPRAVPVSPAAALAAEPQDHPGEAKQCSCGLNPALRVWLRPSAMGSMRPQEWPLPGCHKSACSWWGHPSPPSNCPLPRANVRSRREAGPLGGNAFRKKAL